MAHEDTITYEYADEKKTVVLRVQTDHFDLAAMQEKISEFDAAIAALPEQKPSLTREKYDNDFTKTGLSFDDAAQAIDLLNMESDNGTQRQRLTEQKDWWTERLTFFRKQAEAK